MAEASRSPRISSFTGSHLSLRPRRRERFARWQAVVVWWPPSTSAMGRWRLFTQSRKLRAWRSNCWALEPASLMASTHGSGLTLVRSGPPAGWPWKTGMALAGLDFMSGKTSKPAREMVMLPLGPKNSRPVPARRPGVGFAEGMGGGEAGVLEERVLRVGRFADTLHRKAAAAGGNGGRS